MATLLTLIFLIAQILPVTGQDGTGTGTVEGRVIRAGTSEPIVGASVNLSAIGPLVTDENGRFKLPNVHAGSYRVSATRTGYLPGSFGEHGPNGPGRIFSVNAGQEVKDIVIQLSPKGAVSGRVFSVNGDPVRNAPVQLMKYMYVDGRHMLTVSQQIRTNEAGEYQFGDVPSERYVVSATSPERATSLPVYFPSTIDPDTTSPIDLLPGIEY
jgi:Carboxypeptidase regulatory-like domain